MMFGIKLFEEIALLLSQDNVNHILLPRKTLFKMFLVQIPIAAVSLLFWNGIWILVAVPLMAFWGWYERIYFKVWRQYYAAVSFFIQLLFTAALGFIGRHLFYFAFDLMLGK